MNKIVGQMRKAIEDYHMIENNDKIAVGVSGGKDSLILLTALSKLQKYYPKKFELVGISLDMGFEKTDYSQIQAFCKEQSIPYIIKKTQIKEIIFDYRKEKNPCALCANLRRGALNDTAANIGCNKVALGHHRDDVIETFMLSLFYEGRVSCFSPVTYLDHSQLFLIRPLIYVPEYRIRSVANHLNLPILKNECPACGNTKRQFVKDLAKDLELQNKGVKKRLFTAVQRSEIQGWKLE